MTYLAHLHPCIARRVLDERPSGGWMSTRSGVDIDLFSRTVCADVMMLVGATMAFAPGPVARLARPHRALSAASMSVVESEDTLQAADEVLESLLEVGAPTGMRRKMAEGLRQKQLAITDLVSSADGVTFQEDAWTRPKGGGGITRVLAGGNVWEKAGVALSVVHGTMPYQTFLTANPAAAKKAAEDGITGPDSGEIGYFATGLSCVMPAEPMAPMHFNYRYFETDDGIWWLAAGRLTPSYSSRRTSSRSTTRPSATSTTRVLPALQEVGRRVLLHQAPWRDARPWRHLLRRPERSRAGGAVQLRDGLPRPLAPPTSPSLSSTRTTSSRRSRRSGSRCAGGATSSSTLSTIAARFLDSRRVDASNRS